MINNHMTHLEDVLFESPDKVKTLFNQMLDDIEANNYDNFSVKIDGSPSIIIGVEDGQFFVATKGLFNKVPIKYTKLEDFNTIKEASLRDKLISVFENYKGTIKNGIYQGDLLFTEKDVELVKNDQETYITFCPNIIIYRLYENVQNQNIENLRIGVAWHTSYRREITGELTKHSQAPIQSFFQAKEQILNIFPTYSSLCKGTWRPIIKKPINNINFDNFTLSPHLHYLSKVINHSIRKNNDFSPMMSKEHFDILIDQMADIEINKRKTESVKQRIREHFDEVKQHITEAHCKIYYEVIGYKNLLFNYIHTPSNKSLIPVDEISFHEGFVYKDIKIVLRHHFSAMNFLRHAKNN